MSVPQIQITARDFYVLQKGIPLGAAVAAVAVFYRESKLEPGSQGNQPTETPGVLNPAGAYGIFSANGPIQQDLLTYATKHGLPVDSLETQLSFALTEFANKYPSVWAAMRSTASYRAIVPIIVNDFERPKDREAEIRDALIVAEALAAVPPPSAQPTAPAPTAPAPVESRAQASLPVPIPPAPVPEESLPPPTTIATSVANLRGSYMRELSAYVEYLNTHKAALDAQFDAEIAEVNAIISGEPRSSAAPTAIPAPTPAKGTTMPLPSIAPILRSVATNWVTSTMGTVVGSPALLDIISSIGTAAGPNWKADIIPLAQMLLGLAAKDGWVTGGTTPATPEAVNRVNN
jgi:Phage tail lysozyme